MAGTHSGSGKTTITLGMLAALRKKGMKVQPFKTGPDFIDTGLHAVMAGQVSRNLDLWMCGENYVRECFRENSADADIAVIEGVMGMFDGNLSTANLASVLGLPVILVVDAYGMAESAGAVVQGFVAQAGQAGTNIAGVIFNRIGSERHFKRVKDSIRDVRVLGYLPRSLDFSIPERHLGLTIAEENPIAEKEIVKLADAIIQYIDLDYIVHEIACAGVGAHPEITSKAQSVNRTPLRIGIARDSAFCFYYEDNLDLLKAGGVELVRFSPINDEKIPEDIDALYFGGGYPELHAEKLSGNESMLRAIKSFSDAGGSIYAECGGFMYLMQGIHNFKGEYFPLAGVFPFKAKMKKGRSSLGYREAEMKEGGIFGVSEKVRGHEFHYSEIEKTGFRDQGSGVRAERVYLVRDGEGNPLADEGYKVNNTFGSYVHIHFGSNVNAVTNLIQYIKERHGTYSSCRTR
ncbi:MAG: cobyrinate a,c-diamide synthase [Nitrospira sp.]|nr:cobyrinate a,c-diamide synthase [Nitrospira sp.]